MLALVKVQLRPGPGTLSVIIAVSVGVSSTKPSQGAVVVRKPAH